MLDEKTWLAVGKPIYAHGVQQGLRSGTNVGGEDMTVFQFIPRLFSRVMVR